MAVGATFLVPFEPNASNPFDRAKAAHLLRRTGFGASREAIDKAVNAGLEATVESLFESGEVEKQESEFQGAFQAIAGKFANLNSTEGLESWWIYRMVETRTPLLEKLTLFWHGHFATSNEKVDDAWLMHRQIESLRRHAWGNLRELTLAMARDPAMIVWLDGESNTKERPNENFARELMELFTCGIGQYTENDVREAARAFTGWHRQGEEFAFQADQHDPGRKKFLGKTGRLDGVDVVDILMQDPATPRAIGTKLLKFFGAPEPRVEVVNEATESLVRTRLDLKWFLRELFLSRWFFSDECRKTRLASPVEYVVGSIRTLGARWAATDLVGRLAEMGQRLYAPPNVKGWDGETAWINSTTLSARQNFARDLAALNDGNPLGNTLDLAKLVPNELNEPAKVVELLSEILFQGELPKNTRQDIQSFLVTVEPDGEKQAAADLARRGAEMFGTDEGFRSERVRQAIGILLALPEYQAC